MYTEHRTHRTVDLKQDPNGSNSRVAECRSQTVPKHDFENFWSSEQHADCTKKLARYDFLLVFYSDFRTNWNRCREICRKSQRTVISNEQCIAAATKVYME